MQHGEWEQQQKLPIEAGIQGAYFEEGDGGAGRQLYHIVPKRHMAQHLGEAFAYMNPKFYWTFKAEDFVGKKNIEAGAQLLIRRSQTQS